MIDNLPIVFNASARPLLTSLSEDRIFLQEYVNQSTNFRQLSLKVKMTPCIKLMHSFLFAVTKRPMPPAKGFCLGWCHFYNR